MWFLEGKNYDIQKIGGRSGLRWIGPELVKTAAGLESRRTLREFPGAASVFSEGGVVVL